MRLNAELLAVRESMDGGPVVAVLYLIDSSEVIRLSVGAEVAGMTVASIDVEGVVLQKGQQTLRISRRRD
ncbi:MAG: hypothetical protein ACNA8P_04865 [Phycisphaerales bacterium]